MSYCAKLISPIRGLGVVNAHESREVQVHKKWKQSFEMERLVSSDNFYRSDRV